MVPVLLGARSFGTVWERYLFSGSFLEKVLGALKTEYYTTCCVSAKLPKLWPTAVSQCIFQVKCLTDFQVPMRESAQTDFLKYAFNWKKCNKMTRELECIFVGYQFYSSITPEWLPTGGKIVPMVPELLGDLELQGNITFSGGLPGKVPGALKTDFFGVSAFLGVGEYQACREIC